MRGFIQPQMIGTDPNSIAASVAQLGSTIANGPQTQLMNQLRQAQLAGDQIGAQKTAFELQQLQDTAQHQDTVANMIGKFGQIDPTTNKPYEGGPDLAAESVRAGLKANDVGGYGLLASAPEGPRSPNVTNYQIASGKPYSDTAQSFDINQANDVSKAKYAVDATNQRNDPNYLFNQYFGLAKQQGMSDADAKTYGLTQASKHGAGMSITSPDGTTIQFGNNAGMPQSVTGKLDEQNLAGQQTLNTINMLQNLAKGHPEYFGVAGLAKRGVQTGMQMAGSLASLGNPKLNDAVKQAQNAIAQSGIDPSAMPGLFDPKMSALDTFHDLLLYQVAQELSGGQRLNESEIKAAQDIVPKADEWNTSLPEYLAKTEALRQWVVQRNGLNNTALSKSGKAAVGGEAPPPQAAAPSQIKTEQEYNALPKGATYIAPDGSTRTKQ